MSITRHTRQRLQAAFRERGISDDTLLEQCFEIAMETRSLSLTEDPGAKWRAPQVQMVRELTGERVDDVLLEWVIEKVGQHTPAELRACYFEWRKRNYRKGAYGWLEWLETGIPDREAESASKPSGRNGGRVQRPVLGQGQGGTGKRSEYADLFTGSTD